jgi:hypothetical protein
MESLGYKIKSKLQKPELNKYNELNNIRAVLFPYTNLLNFKKKDYDENMKFDYEDFSENKYDVRIAKFYDEKKFNSVRFFKNLKSNNMHTNHIVFFVKQDSCFYQDFEDENSETYQILDKLYEHFKLPIVCDVISKTIVSGTNFNDKLFQKSVDYRLFQNYHTINTFISGIYFEEIKDTNNSVKLVVTCRVCQLGYYTDEYNAYPDKIEEFDVVYKEERTPIHHM